MTRFFFGLTVLIMAATFSINAQGQSGPCGSGATLAEVDLEAVSRIVMCGTVGNVSVVVRARVVRVLAGPPVDGTFLGVIVCPGYDVVERARTVMCIGETAPPIDHSRSDAFVTDNRPRRYLRYARLPPR